MTETVVVVLIINAIAYVLERWRHRKDWLKTDFIKGAYAVEDYYGITGHFPSREWHFVAHKFDMAELRNADEWVAATEAEAARCKSLLDAGEVYPND